MNEDMTYCLGVGKFLCKTCKRLREKNDATRWYINPPYKNGSCKVYLPIEKE